MAEEKNEKQTEEGYAIKEFCVQTDTAIGKAGSQELLNDRQVLLELLNNQHLIIKLLKG